MPSLKSIEDYVFSLSSEEFSLLQEAVDKRIDQDTFGFTTFEQAAEHYGRIPTCPKCGSTLNHKDGFTPSHHRRYRFGECGNSFTLLTSSIFNSAKIPFHKLNKYIQLMSFNVPLEVCKEVLQIGSNTAELWRKKIFSTVDEYQNHLILNGRVWIDETYVEDYSLAPIKSQKHLRGLSHTKICIVVAIDTSKNMVAIISGHAKPSSKRILKALKAHIKPGSTIVHDGDKSHNELIKNLQCKSEVYISKEKTDESLKQMALVNNMCSWLKRYLWRFLGMNLTNLQSYLNWFIYLQRVKRDGDKWPKNERILRHLLLSNAQRKRK